MKIHNNIEQNTPEWHELRAGKLTASNAYAISVAKDGLETVVLDTMARKFSFAEPESYSNEDMERGNELESQAIDMYEMEAKVKTETVGFVSSDDGCAGCSPDKFIDDKEGMVEVKCPNDKNFLKLMVLGINGIKKEYICQMQMQMLICERKYCVFVAYNPNFTKSLIIHRFEIDPEMQEKLKIGISKGTNRIKEIENMLK